MVWGTVLAGAWAKNIPHNSQKVQYRKKVIVCTYTNNNQTAAGHGSAIAAALAAAGQRDSVSVGRSGTAMKMAMSQQHRGLR